MLTAIHKEKFVGTKWWLLRNYWWSEAAETGKKAAYKFIYNNPSNKLN